VISGTTYVLVAFDIAYAIDLDAAERVVAGLGSAGTGERATMRHTRKSPPYFEYRPAPLRLTLGVEPIELGNGFATSGQVEALVFDFGAVSLTYAVGLGGRGLGEVVGLAEALYDNAAVHADARRRVAELARVLGPALERASLVEAVEDYLVHQIGAVEGHAEPSEVARGHSAALAQVLRSEGGPMSEEEQREALSARASYRPSDAAYIDWNAAVLLDAGAEDVRAVLEYANVELLEMRVLDDRLDAVLDESYRALAERKTRKIFRFPVGSRDLNRIARLQMDSALLYEGVNNALKLVGDQYLARVYRMAAGRFHLPERDATIERKLRTVESIYGKLHDWQASVRLEVLEWIVIALIFVSIVLPFMPWGRH
jgi:hypothetical protein